MKIKEWQELFETIAAKYPDMSKSKRRQQCFDFCRKAAKGAHAAFERSDPELCNALLMIARKYKQRKCIQADWGDLVGIPCSHPERTGQEVQYLHRILPETNRFFICRNLECSAEGCFFGYNTDWISTCAQGGWKFACPHCAHPYSMNLQKKRGLLQANHIWHLEKDQSLMLAEWPDSLTERAINESAVVMAEHAEKRQFDKLSHDDVKLKIASAVSKTAVKFDAFRTMQVTAKVMSDIKLLNSTRGEKRRTAGTTSLLTATKGHSTSLSRM